MMVPSLRSLLFLAMLGFPVPILQAQADGAQPQEKERHPGGDLPVQDQGEIQKMESLQGPENMSVHAFTDPDPLPRGGSGTIYILLSVGKSRFLTRGPGETFVKPPAKAGPLSLGKVQWPPSSGNFRHPETGRVVPGWTGQVFVKIPVLVSRDAPFGPVSFKIDFQFRVLSVRPPVAGMVNVDPIQFLANVGPPLPQVTFPEKPISSAPPAGPAPVKKERGENPRPARKDSPAVHRKEETGRVLPATRETSRPGAEGGAVGEDSPLLPETGGILASAPLVFGAAGLLVLIALLFLFKGGKSR